MDTVLIRLMAFIIHQASLDGLPGTMKTPDLIDLEMESRNMTGVAMSQVVTDQFRMENTSGSLESLRILPLYIAGL